MTGPTPGPFPETLSVDEQGIYGEDQGRGTRVAFFRHVHHAEVLAEACRRWNAHADLVAALESLVGTEYDDGSEDEGELRAVDVAGIDAQGYELQECIDAARAALAKAKGGES